MGDCRDLKQSEPHDTVGNLGEVKMEHECEARAVKPIHYCKMTQSTTSTPPLTKGYPVHQEFSPPPSS